ncbi:MAG: MerR family transcriptional regulator [Paraprevotella sp.]|nr:MerR family transcriptional regulator [Paraprevotella sp.]MBQ8282900.1 MerR family transcriptional regulator [Paraprevotella sp.]MBR2380603.1 MerR family transcriptional regulator [Paraprevotella sp.]
MALNLNKDLKLYYSISEVAEMFGLSETLLRYWEKEFPTISPKKSGRNIRQYSQADIDQIRLVYNLVKVRGMKLAAARKALKNSREEIERNLEVMGRLEAVRNELMSIKRELDGLV